MPDLVTPVDAPLQVIGNVDMGNVHITLVQGQGSTHMQVERLSRGQVMHA